MWFQFLLLIFAFTSIRATIHDDIDRAVGECYNRLDREKLNSMKAMKSRDIHAVICTEIRGFFTCLGDMAQNEFGLTLQEMTDMVFESIDGNGADFLVNFMDTLEEVCVEGTQLNTDLMEDIDCYDEIDKSAVESECKNKGVAAYEVFKDLAENAEEFDEDGEITADRECIRSAYEMACMASAIHDTCGRRAFETFSTIVKRTTFFRNALCSEEALEKLKTSFVEGLEMEQREKELFRLAFDLRKRRK